MTKENQNHSPRKGVMRSPEDKEPEEDSKESVALANESVFVKPSGSDNQGSDNQESLSDKIVLEAAIKAFKDNTKTGWIHIFDVKEFIKKLKEEICKSGNYCDRDRAIWFREDVIDTLAGKELLE